MKDLYDIINKEQKDSDGFQSVWNYTSVDKIAKNYTKEILDELLKNFLMNDTFSIYYKNKIQTEIEKLRQII